ncbi:MAG: hypothetical protein ACR2J7_03520 [Luteimonas sp.]
MVQPNKPQAPAATVGFVFPQEAEDALARGEMLEAIRALRMANRHLDLKSAKEAIESYAASARPGPAKQAKQAMPRMPRVPTVVEGDDGSPGVLLVVILVVLAAALWWLFGAA